MVSKKDLYLTDTESLAINPCTAGQRLEADTYEIATAVLSRLPTTLSAVRSFVRGVVESWIVRLVSFASPRLVSPLLVDSASMV